MKRLFFFATLQLACIKAPAIVMVDRATALEQQASGSYADLEKKLVRAGLQPRPVQLTPEQLETLGIRPPSLTDQSEQTEADRVDMLLKQHCLGEAKDGTLADTHESCKGAFDREGALALVERVNGARLSLWRWIRARRPEATPEEVRNMWQKTHARGVPCGGWVQRDDGSWEAKKC
jgi:hypothetical protein